MARKKPKPKPKSKPKPSGDARERRHAAEAERIARIKQVKRTARMLSRVRNDKRK
jgi:hypothetical protein